MRLNDTIAAIATVVGESGIGIIRISGKRANAIADKIFVSKAGSKPSSFKTYTTHYGWVMSGEQVVDEVILTVMRKPRSYTKEDIVEINSHGGIIPLRRILELVLDLGARLAQPGEFTQRAFLNGRIDLAQAEAVLDIIRAKTDSALVLSQKQLKGELSQKLNQLRKKLLNILSALEANIDFPDEDLGLLNIDKTVKAMIRLQSDLELLLDGSNQGRVFREGIKAVICGKPNVGKSSLLNALLKCERSIVTHIAGTTRDTIEDIIDIKGIPVRIIDTAGIIEPRDLIEKKAVARSHLYIKEADLILLILDGSRSLSSEDSTLMRKMELRPTLVLVNKIDLKQKIKYNDITGRFKQIVKISAKRKKNIDLLEKAIAESVFGGKIKPNQPIYVTNLRHIQQLKKIQKLVSGAKNSIKSNLSLEFIAQDIKEALGCLDRIQGKHFSQALLDKIFSQFCIGK